MNVKEVIFKGEYVREWKFRCSSRTRTHYGILKIESTGPEGRLYEDFFDKVTR